MVTSRKGLNQAKEEARVAFIVMLMVRRITMGDGGLVGEPQEALVEFKLPKAYTEWFYMFNTTLASKPAGEEGYTHAINLKPR